MLLKRKMDADSYHKICNEPSSFTRSELEQTYRALESDNSPKTSLLLNALQSEPLQKPLKHQAGKDSDYFSVQISAKDAEEIIEVLGDLEAGAVGSYGETTALASSYASLLDRWFIYVESL